MWDQYRYFRIVYLWHTAVESVCLPRTPEEVAEGRMSGRTGNAHNTRVETGRGSCGARFMCSVPAWTRPLWITLYQLVEAHL